MGDQADAVEHKPALNTSLHTSSPLAQSTGLSVWKVPLALLPVQPSALLSAGVMS